jgi:hypothetical protein
MGDSTIVGPNIKFERNFKVLLGKFGVKHLISKLDIIFMLEDATGGCGPMKEGARRDTRETA